MISSFKQKKKIYEQTLFRHWNMLQNVKYVYSNYIIHI